MDEFSAPAVCNVPVRIVNKRYRVEYVAAFKTADAADRFLRFAQKYLTTNGGSEDYEVSYFFGEEYY